MPTVLISHRYRFIYLKTMKTASTSVEIYFEPACLPAEHYSDRRQETEQIVTEAGVIGARKPDTTKSEWFNHMPAAAVRDKVGPEIWSRYRKFCVIRNPFDKVVSWWWHRRGIGQPGAERFRDDQEIRYAFNSWVLRTTDMMMDRDKYVIGGELCVDRTLRYEHLLADTEELSEELGLAKSNSAMGKYNSGFRHSSMSFASYYEPAAAAKVAAWFDWELKHFGYSLHPPT
jgi:hypothetical protein